LRALSAAVLVAAGLWVTGAPAAQASGVCTIVGTPGNDLLTGTPGDDVICGRGGADKILGLGGDDVLRGGRGPDIIRGGTGDDRIVGGPDDDRLFGQAGDDEIRGDSGADQVIGGGGDDRLGGAQGDDLIRATDGPRHVDTVRCGDGDDLLLADGADQVRPDCEHVEQNDPPSDITLKPAAVWENELVGTDIGELSAKDPDEGDEVTFTLVSGAGSGDNDKVSLDGADLESAAQLDHEETPTLSVRVRATDILGEFTERAITITVRDANDPPVAGDDEIYGTENAFVDAATNDYYGLLANDSDQDGDALAITAVGNAVGGEVQLLSDVVRFYPNPDTCGQGAGSYDYTVSDGNGGTDIGTVVVNIGCQNSSPVAGDDAFDVVTMSSAQIETASLLVNDTDPDLDELALTEVSNPVGGTVDLQGELVTYTPHPSSECGAVGGFDYSVSDGHGGTDTGHVTMTVVCPG
jgi:VCBS repeat-containing protein